MISSNFAATMTDDELKDGEANHQKVEPSPKMAMAAGLTKSSDELKRIWENERDAYLTLLGGAAVAYEQNKFVEEFLRNAIARVTSVVDDVDSVLMDGG